MIAFPIAKVNLGLNVVEKRPDGYHNLETVFYPVPIKDVLEIQLMDREFPSAFDQTSPPCPASTHICGKEYPLRPAWVAAQATAPT